MMFLRRRVWVDVLCILTVLFAVAAVYGRNATFDFVNWDDGNLMYLNPIVTQFTGWPALKIAFTSYDPELYIPLTFLTYQVEHALVGLHPALYHLTNVCLHALNALLVYWLLFLLSRGRKDLAFLTALLFALHPVNAEAVSWVSARKDLLSGFFALASSIAYLRSRARFSWISASLFLCALLSKVSVALLPLVFLLFDWFLTGRITRRNVVGKWPFALLSVLFIVIALLGKTANLSGLPVEDHVLLAVRSTMFTLSKLFFPFHLSAFYHQTHPITLFSVEFWPSIVGIILLFSLVVLLRKYRALLVATLAYLLLILPSFTTFRKSQEIILFASDRYVYLASVALLALTVCSVLRFLGGKYPRIGVVSFLCVGALFGFLSYRHSGAWANTLSLYEHAVAARPDTYIAQHNLGVEYLNAGRTQEAITHLGIAIGIDPKRPIAYENMARALAAQGRYEEALAYTLQALALNPAKREEYEEALRKIEEAGGR
ncbi:hypothetical protein COU80_05560 [Candidatus Peregrinibacteria bacterium CG10_big_fil_rev_8_21_14_0_10_55_24]|nr:MAG: hypothetical protein COU80_05560 [Candidatus Peregrinibacteria bacterium CG10_big_fil_rev_8_21_14_0_10_55_24]